MRCLGLSDLKLGRLEGACVGFWGNGQVQQVHSCSHFLQQNDNARYFSRLWCTFEIATFMKDPEQRGHIQFMPLKMGAQVILSSIFWHIIGFSYAAFYMTNQAHLPSGCPSRPCHKQAVHCFPGSAFSFARSFLRSQYAFMLLLHDSCQQTGKSLEAGACQILPHRYPKKAVISRRRI